MTETPSPDREPTDPTHKHRDGAISDDGPHTVIEQISNRSFNTWYEERQVEENILDGKAYFNGQAPPKPPERHTPSKLLQCHRKASYDRQNAPCEGTPPQGLFWIGTEFEEQVIVPYLQDIVPDDLYVQNSLWIDTTITASDADLQLRGSTDPAIVTADADPVLLTEIKTTTSLDHLTMPKPHHRAQLHAYLAALNDEHDHSITNGLIIYGSRKTLDIKVFPVAFDNEFWRKTVVEWMAEQTAYEQADELPPADPETDWECSYCSYKHRCGEADSPYSDIGYNGLLPLFTEYDRQTLIDYLNANADQGAKLTPALAHEFPELAARYGVYDWTCPACSTAYQWDAVDWNGTVTDPPICRHCADQGTLVTLSGPEPDEQLNP